MVEGARLESVYTGNRIEGSNPSLTARIGKIKALKILGFQGLFLSAGFVAIDKMSKGLSGTANMAFL